MDRLFDIIAKWEPFGQWVFFVVVLAILTECVVRLSYHMAVLFRGWPGSNSEDEGE